VNLRPPRHRQQRCSGQRHWSAVVRNRESWFHQLLDRFGGSGQEVSSESWVLGHIAALARTEEFAAVADQAARVLKRVAARWVGGPLWTVETSCSLGHLSFADSKPSSPRSRLMTYRKSHRISQRNSYSSLQTALATSTGKV
jgi:hypothetical protein